MITVDQVMAWQPCYTRERVEAIVGDGLTPLEVLDLDIPAEHRVWALCQNGAVPTRVRTKAIDATVARCMAAYTPGTVIEEWGRKWLSGEDRSAAAAWRARDAADARAAGAAVADAAWAAVAWAAVDAADGSSADGALFAACSASRATWSARAAGAAWLAARAMDAAEAAAAAERDLQLDDFRTAIMAGEVGEGRTIREGGNHE